MPLLVLTPLLSPSPFPQVAERQRQAREADQEEATVAAEARQEEQLSDALLRQEARSMATQGYRPWVSAVGSGSLCSP